MHHYIADGSWQMTKQYGSGRKSDADNGNITVPYI